MQQIIDEIVSIYKVYKKEAQKENVPAAANLPKAEQKEQKTQESQAQLESANKVVECSILKPKD